MENTNITIESVTANNYHLFDDIVFWRISKLERSVFMKLNIGGLIL